jgi:hypothetical protein
MGPTICLSLIEKTTQIFSEEFQMLMGANMIKGAMIISLLIVHSSNILELFQ